MTATALLPDSDQDAAVELIGRAKLGVVTGGPGTGKTTILNRALHGMTRGANVVLAAPTGKAARRMQEATGREATTIHRLLGYDKHGFKHDETNPIDAEVVIIDESSMLDLELADALIRALPSYARLILVGDANQLPPVGPGDVFRDILASDTVPSVRLTTLHRAAAGSWVCKNAPVVLRGQMPSVADSTDFRWWRADSVEATVDRVCWGAVRDTDELLAGKLQILTPRRRSSDLGSLALNMRIKTALNPHSYGSPGLKCAMGVYVNEGDRVIHTRNNYTLGVMNGETGRVVSVDNRRGLEVLFDHGGAVKYSANDAKHLELGYTLTIHKSQGSEWPWVIVICHSSHNFMLCRQLFYTAITRAREGVILVGDEAGLQRAITNNQPALRQTRLKHKLIAASGAVHAR